MNKESSDYNITIKASCRRELETQLDKAVEEGIAAAIKCSSQGLVVTRHDYTTFRVELSHNVPFGITVERDRLKRRGSKPAAGADDKRAAVSRAS